MLPLFLPRSCAAVRRWLGLTGLLLAGRLVAAPPAADPNPAGSAARATVSLALPANYQVVQRTAAGGGTVRIEGGWSIPRHATVTPDALEYRIVAPEAAPGAPPAWKPLPFNPRVHGFRTDVPLADGGWYQLDVRLRHGGDILAGCRVEHFGVGEVFLIAGQSNSANYAEQRQQPKSGLVSAFDGEHWQPANDPQPGATGTKGSFIPSFGDALVRRLHVPVGVVCIGVGSTSVREWMPAGQAMTLPPTTGAHCLVLDGGRLVSSGELFDRLTQRLRAFPPHGIRAVLWHQGESDWRQPEGHTLPLAEYRSDLGELIADSRIAARWDVPWFVAQVSYGNPQQTGSDEFRAQQRAVVDGRLTLAGPNTDTLTGPLREKNGQGVHFSAEGQIRHGELWADIVSRWLAGPVKSE